MSFSVYWYVRRKWRASNDIRHHMSLLVVVVFFFSSRGYFKIWIENGKKSIFFLARKSDDWKRVESVTFYADGMTNLWIYLCPFKLFEIISCIVCIVCPRFFFLAYLNKTCCLFLLFSFLFFHRSFRCY